MLCNDRQNPLSRLYMKGARSGGVKAGTGVEMQVNQKDKISKGAIFLTGNIGKYAVIMEIHIKGQNIVGQYGYTSQKNGMPFKLKGSINKEGQVTMLCGEEKFLGTYNISRRSFNGYWISKDKKLAVVLSSPNAQSKSDGPFNLSQLRGHAAVAAKVFNIHRDQIVSYAKASGISPEVIVAIVCAESQGYAGSNGRMLLRFEVHKFYELWGRNHEMLFSRHFKFNRTGKKWLGHQYSSDGKRWIWLHPTGSSADLSLQYDALKIALSLGHTAREAAFACLGMGLGQVQGFNFQSAGYRSAEAMFEDLSKGEHRQIDMIFQFINQKKPLKKAAQSRNFKKIELYYNGGGQGGVYANYMLNYANALIQSARLQKINLMK